MALQRVYLDETADGVRVMELSPAAGLPNFLVPSRWPAMVQIVIYGLVLGSVAGVVGLMLGFDGGAAFVVGAFIGAFYASVDQNKRLAKRDAAARACLALKGFQADYALFGVLVDSRIRKIAFFNLQDDYVDLYDLSDVTGCQIRWKNETTVTRTPINNNARVSKHETGHALIFHVRNPETPRYGAVLPNRAVGETWVARMQALVEG
ncbi:hypothetical protein [Chitinimonas naiadis]